VSVKRPRNARPWAVLLLAFFYGAAASLAWAGSTQAVLAVDLASPGVAVSRIVFFVQSPGVGTQAANALANHQQLSISVRSFPGALQRLGGTPATTAVSFAGADLVKVTLTPLRVWSAGDRVSFILTVAGSNTARIVTSGGAAPPAWFTSVPNPGGNGFVYQPIPATLPLPGFLGVVNDADLTLYNDLSAVIGIRNLLILPNITPLTFAALDLDALFSQPTNPSLPRFTLAGPAFRDFPTLPDPAPGNVLAAEGQILDPLGNVTGTFALGVQQTLDIFSSIVNPVFAGTPGNCPTGWACDGSPAPGFASYAAGSAQYPGGAPFATSSFSPTVWSGSGTIRQVTAATWVAGNTYVLNLYVGLPNTEPDGSSPVAGWPPTVRVYLTAGGGGAQVAAFDIPSPGRGQFLPNLVSFTAPNNFPFAGQNIGVLIFVSAAPNGYSANFDIAPASLPDIVVN